MKATDLLKSAASSASAYMQYTQQKARRETAVFIFVEDNDDAAVYGHFSPGIENPVFLGCGGRAGVLDVCRTTSVLHTEAHPVCYIIDRDIGRGTVPPEVLKTRFYSWESHICELSAVRYLLLRKAVPAFTPGEATLLSENWGATMESFRDVLALQTALLTEVVRLSLDGVGIGDCPINLGAAWEGGVMIPGEQVFQWLTEKREQCIQMGGGEKRIDDVAQALKDTPVIEFARGKTLFSLAKHYLRHVADGNGRTFNVDVSSPIVVSYCLPQTWMPLAYVGDYLSMRQAKAA